MNQNNLNLNAPPKSSPGIGGFSERQIKTLDWIHGMFLLYSGAHNVINAWHRSHNILFFLFIAVGIISVELMLYSIYKNWKNGQLVGRMLVIGKQAGFVAMFYATAGILAQAQTGLQVEGGWLSIYYQWILPSSAPAMFLYACWIQAVDPVMMATRDAAAYETLFAVEVKQEALEGKRGILMERKELRLLRQHVQRQKLLALRKESVSRRTRVTLEKAARIKMPRLLESIGVPIRDVQGLKRNMFGRLQLPEYTETAQTQNPAADLPGLAPLYKANPPSTNGAPSTNENGTAKKS